MSPFWTTRYDWRADPNLPRGREVKPVVIVEDISLLAVDLVRRDAVEDRIAAAVVVQPVAMLREWQEEQCYRVIPALRVQRQGDLAALSVDALGVPSRFRALVIAPREQIDLFRIDTSGRDTDRNWIEYTNVLGGFRYEGSYNTYDPDACRRFPRVDLVIVHGSTGPDAWPMRPEWVRLLRDQCKKAGVAFAFLGWGDFLPEPWIVAENGEYLSQTTPWSSGRDRELKVCCVGAERAGRQLDGKEHLELPEGL